jgi:hypothetical protein
MVCLKKNKDKKAGGRETAGHLKPEARSPKPEARSPKPEA